EHHMANFTGIPKGTAQRPAFLDDAQTKANTEIEIAEIADLPSRPVKALADGRGGRVIVEGYGFPRRFGDKAHRIYAGPAGKGGRADRAHAFDLERTGHHHAHAEQARR